MNKHTDAEAPGCRLLVWASSLTFNSVADRNKRPVSLFPPGMLQWWTWLLAAVYLEYIHLPTPDVKCRSEGVAIHSWGLMWRRRTTLHMPAAWLGPLKGSPSAVSPFDMSQRLGSLPEDNCRRKEMRKPRADSGSLWGIEERRKTVLAS